MWDSIEKLLRREEADLSVLAKFYHWVVHTVLLLVTETYVMLAETTKKLEVVRVGFLQKVTRMKVKIQKDISWWKVES